MESFSLKLTFQDAIKSVFHKSLLPIIIGLGVAAYRNNEDIQGLIAFGVPGVFFCLFIVVVIVWRITYLRISSTGFSYPNWRGRYVNRKWSDSIEITKSSDRCAIRDVASKKDIQIPLIVFDYPETQMHFKDKIPNGHTLLKLLP